MEKAMTEKKGAGIFMAIMGGIGAAVGLWALAALSFSLSKVGLSEVARQYMVAIGLISEQATMVDFYTHIKGVEYLVCLAFFAAFPVFFKYVNTPKVTVPGQR
ncbi:MAG: hypothetical protein WC256_03190 [Desulfurivibrionaceae bacterium]|jgi:hypothetical protein